MDKEFNRGGLAQDEFLKQYDVSEFERPSVAVDIVLFTITEKEEENYRKLPQKDLKVLLVKRNAHPFQGMWALPGGFIGIDESIEGSARRKLKAKTNIENIYIEQLYTWGDILRDPRTRVLSCSYMSLIDSSQLVIKPGKSEDNARWFGVKFREIRRQRVNTENGYTYERDVEIALENGDDRLSVVIRITTTFEEGTKDIKREIISSEGIAFDHGKIIEYGIERLRNKIEYTDIAFNLMPKHFTLTELQKVYEIIQGKELLAAAFRRKIADMVIETNEYTKDAGHRPSKLYKFNAEWGNNL